MTRREARRRGLRTAAQVAALTGLIATNVGFGRAESATPVVAADAVQGRGDGQASVTDADALARLVRVREVKSCGCAPCWGPPAPPVMPMEQLS